MLTKLMKALICVLLAGCAAPSEDGSADEAGERIASVEAELCGATGALLEQLCNQEYRFERWLDAGDGVAIHVIERFSGRAVARFPRRAILMLPATIAPNAWFDANIPGDPTYNALHQMARRGFFALAMSYEGFRESSRPADGTTVTAQRCLEHAGEVLEWIRVHRGVPKVDVLGNSIGAGIAMALGGTESPINYHHVNRVVISTALYKLPSPMIEAIYTPAYEAYLRGLPGGYITSTPATYAGLFTEMTPEGLAWADTVLPGEYAVGPLLEVFDLPFFEAAPGRAPMLQFWGSDNPVTPLADVELLASEYGGPYQLAVLQGAAHSPAFESVRHEVWDETAEFLDEGAPGGASPCDGVPPAP